MKRKRLGQHLIEVLTQFVKDFEAGKVKPPRYKITTLRKTKNGYARVVEEQETDNG